jgi:hypothetical protein
MATKDGHDVSMEACQAIDVIREGEDEAIRPSVRRKVFNCVRYRLGRSNVRRGVVKEVSWLVQSLFEVGHLFTWLAESRPVQCPHRIPVGALPIGFHEPLSLVVSVGDDQHDKGVDLRVSSILRCYTAEFALPIPKPHGIPSDKGGVAMLRDESEAAVRCGRAHDGWVWPLHGFGIRVAIFKGEVLTFEGDAWLRPERLGNV